MPQNVKKLQNVKKHPKFKNNSKHYPDKPSAYIEHVRMTHKHNVLCSVAESAISVGISFFLPDSTFGTALG